MKISKRLVKSKIRTAKLPKASKSGSEPKIKLLARVSAVIVLLVSLGIGAKIIYNRLCLCDFFQITAVRIEGTHMTNKEQIAALSRIDIHSNLLALDIAQMKSLLESHPWISRAEIVRGWPNRLTIVLEEKKPAVLINRNNGLYYLDGSGGIIAAVSPSQEVDFPVITGLENYPFTDTAAEIIPEPLREVYELLRLANRNNPILPEQNISEIHVAAKGELILYLLEKPFPIYLGNAGKMSTRYYRLVKVLKDLYKTQEFSEVSYIRLDYQDDAILVGKLESDRINQG